MCERDREWDFHHKGGFNGLAKGEDGKDDDDGVKV